MDFDKGRSMQVAPILRDGRGLKLSEALGATTLYLVAPILRDGRGLKQELVTITVNSLFVAPILRDGRGLKLVKGFGCLGPTV